MQRPSFALSATLNRSLLFLFGERERLAWLLPAKARRRILVTAALTGAWGVLTGFALFVLLSPEVGHFHGREGLLRLALVIAVAVAAASFVERLRHLIQEPNEHHGADRSLGPAVLSVLLLAVFELCVMAYEHATERSLESRYVMQELAQRTVESADIAEGYALLWPEDVAHPDSLLTVLTTAANSASDSPVKRFADLLREPDRRALSRCYPHRDEYLCESERGILPLDAYGNELIYADRESSSDSSVQPQADPRSATNPLFDWAEPLGKSKLVDPFDPRPLRTFPARTVAARDTASRRRPPRRYESSLGSTESQETAKPASDSAWNPYEALARRLDAEKARRTTLRGRVETLTERVADRIRARSHLTRSAFDQLPYTPWLQSAVATPTFLPDSGVRPAATPLVLPPVPEEKLAVDLSDALNHVLLRRDVYRSEYFDSMQLDPGLQALLEDVRRSGAEENAASLHRVVALNRQLMAAALPGFIPPDPTSAGRKLLDLGVMMGLWLVAGVVLSLTLARFVIARQSETQGGALRGLVTGVRAGILTAVIGVGLYVVAVRSVYLLGGLAADQTMGSRLSALYVGTGSPWLRVLMLPVALAQLAWVSGIWARLGLIAVVLLAALLWRRRIRWPAVLLLVCVAAFALRPYLSWSAPVILVLAVIAWGIPGALLGAGAPFLRPTLAPRADWAWLAWAAGIVVAVSTIWFKSDGWLYAVALLLLSLGLAIRLRWQLRDWWPIAALLFGLTLAAATAALHRATFKGVLAEIRTLNQRADPLSDLAADTLPHIGSETSSASLYTPRPLWQYEWAALDAEDRDRSIAYEVDVTKRLEVALLGSLGFWITIALFVAWSERDRQNLVLESPDGRKRCFWGRGVLGAYHDRVHGRKPETDRDLFGRLSLEILGGEHAIADRQRWAAELAHFDITALADPQRRVDVPRRDRHAARIVVENARRFADHQKAALGKSPESSPEQTSVLGLLGIGHAPADEVGRRLRRLCVLPRRFPTGTFLQSIGVVPGAHRTGCAFSQERDTSVVATPGPAAHTTTVDQPLAV